MIYFSVYIIVVATDAVLMLGAHDRLMSDYSIQMGLITIKQINLVPITTQLTGRLEPLVFIFFFCFFFTKSFDTPPQIFR